MNPHSVLTPLQDAFLHIFFQQPIGNQFFLTGGTALAEFYLHHRYSEDIDLFTLEEPAFLDVSSSLPAIALSLHAEFEERFSTVSYRQVFIRAPNQAELKIDVIREVGPQFGEHQRLGGVIVDSSLNIAVNKVTAIYGRAAAKDYVDLYFLLRQGFDFDELVRLAKEKDPGLTEFYLAGMLHQIHQVETLPRMIEPVTIEELRAYFGPLAEKIMERVKPTE